MKRNKLFLSLLELMLLALLIISLTTNVQGVSTLDYTFEKDVLYSKSNPVYDSNFNLRNQTTFTGHYPATYSFENDEIGSEPDEWIINNDIGSTSNITTNIYGHDKVLWLYDNSANANEGTIATQTYDFGIVKGIIEFWLMITDNTKKIDIIGGPTTFHLYTSSNILYATGGGTTQIINPIIENLWYHFNLDFSCDTDTYDIYVNGILEVNDKDFEVVADEIISFTIRTDYFNTGNNYSCYLDGLGYSWDKTDYTGTYFDVEIQDNVPTGINWDGEYFWLVGTQNDKVYQYTSEGVYNDVYFDIGTQDNEPRGITWDGEHFWIIGITNNKVYQYTSEGVYNDVYFDVGTQDNEPRGITWDGEHFWVVGQQNNKVYRYTSEGVYTDVYFDIGTQDTLPREIIWDGEHFWMIGNLNDKVYQYTSEGVYTSIYFDIGTQDNIPMGITWDDTYFWLVGTQNNKVYQYIYVETPYNIGDNIIPIIEISSTLEFDKYEFLFEGMNDLFETGDDNPNGWSDIETNGDDVNVYSTGGGYVKILNDADYNPGTGIQLTGRYITGKRINVSFGIRLISLIDNIGSHFDLYLNSSDNTEVIKIYIDENSDLGYYDSGSSKIVLNSDMIDGVYYEFNLFIHYEINLCFLRYSVDNIFIDSYIFPLKVNSKEGLRDIRFELESSSVDNQVNLYYVGIYSNGLSMAEGWGYLTYETNKDWEFEKRNLFIIDVKGMFSIHTVVGDYEHEETMEELIDYYTFEGSKILNVYDIGATYDDCTLVFYFLNFWIIDAFYKGYISDFNSLNIEGVNITEGINTYDLIYTHGSIDVDESYFWVDLNNRLQFSLTVNNDNLEYIQATFNIKDVACETRTVRFTSDIDGNSKGYLILDYKSDRYAPMEFSYFPKTTQVILPQNEYIKSFTILITDNNKDNNDVCEGYITDIKLLYNPDLGITIITLDIIEIIIPLIVMIIPSIIMGKKFGVVGVIITFVLMSLICVIANLIPIWLFFLIAFGCIGFLVMKNKIKVKI